MVNHFEFHREITTKSHLLTNLTQFCDKNGLNVFNLTPPTFLINLNEKIYENTLELKEDLKNSKTNFRSISLTQHKVNALFSQMNDCLALLVFGFGTQK